MASETNKTGYARAGFALVLGACALVATLIYVGGAGNRRNEFAAETYSDLPVSGLSVGSEVNFRGVKVGTVKSISFIGGTYPEASAEDRLKILICLGLDRRMFSGPDSGDPEGLFARLVQQGLRATVTASGITGLSHIEINFPKTPVAAAELSWKPRTLCIPPAPSMLESFSDSATRVMNQIDHMDFVGFWTNLSSVVGNSAAVLDSLNAFLSDERGRIGRILGDLESASGSLREFSAEIRDDPSLLLRSAVPEALPETSR